MNRRMIRHHRHRANVEHVIPLQWVGFAVGLIWI